MTLQEQFDEKYISSSEICERLGVHRSTIYNGLRTGKLPEAITVNRPNGTPFIMLWIREQVEPMLQDWAKSIASRKDA